MKTGAKVQQIFEIHNTLYKINIINLKKCCIFAVAFKKHNIINLKLF